MKFGKYFFFSIHISNHFDILSNTNSLIILKLQLIYSFFFSMGWSAYKPRNLYSIVYTIIVFRVYTWKWWKMFPVVRQSNLMLSRFQKKSCQIPVEMKTEHSYQSNLNLNDTGKVNNTVTYFDSLARPEYVDDKRYDELFFKKRVSRCVNQFF